MGRSDRALVVGGLLDQGIPFLSVADAWIAAAALISRAALVHKDPEFEAITQLIGFSC